MKTEQEMSLEETQSMMQDIFIPPRPTVLTDILNEKQKTNYDTRKIADIISRDVAISAGVIKTINSPFFGLPKEVASIPMAVTMLGINNVTNIVSAISLRKAIEYGDKNFMDKFWNMSTEIALISARLAKEFVQIPPDQAYLLGLLCNCGVPLLMQKFSNYIEVYEKAQSQCGTTVVSLEKEKFQINHSTVGYMVANRWQFPEHICQSILKHHDDKNYFNEDKNIVTSMLAVLKTAEHISLKYNGLKDYHEWDILKNEILAYLKIDAKVLQEIEDDSFEILRQ